MTLGTIVFLGGVGLLIITVILAIIFWAKKPQYIPESAAYNSADGPHTQKLRNGYPTDPLTIRREPQMAVAPDIVIPQKGTERLTESQTDVLPETILSQSTGHFDDQRTEKLADGTVPLSEETTPLQPLDKTVLLGDSAESSDDGTMVLDSTFQTGDTEDISRTTPLSEV